MKLNKLFAGVLAAAMMMSVGVSAMAASIADSNGATYNDMTQATVKVDFTLAGEGTSPAMEFTLEETAAGKLKRAVSGNSALKVEDMPDLGTITAASFVRGAADDSTATTANIVINLPTFSKVGIYTYYLNEKHTATAGVSDGGQEIKLVVTVVNDADGTNKVRIAAVHAEVSGGKSDVITPTYTANKLTVSKTVTGVLGDKENQAFAFTATFSGLNWTDDLTFVEGEDITATKNQDGSYTFNLKHNKDIVFNNIPKGVTIKVTENDYTSDGYTTEINDVAGREYNGTMDASALTAAFENNKGGTVDTGVILDNAPYILMLAVVAGGVFFMVAKKRREE